MTAVSMDVLAAFITARLDEHEASAHRKHDVGLCPLSQANYYTTTPCTCGEPARVSRAVAAKRRVLAECVARWEDVELMLGPDILRQRQWSGLDLAVRLLVSEWADHDEYHPDWRVS